MTSTAISSKSDAIERATIAVVVCAYTDARLQLLLECLDVLLVQLGSADQLVVVIDYNDQLFTTIEDRYAGRSTVIRNTGTKGLSGARNTGVKAAAREIVAFVDDDARVEPGWVEAMCRGYEEADVAGVGGYAQPVWPVLRPEWFPHEFDWVVGCSHRGLPREAARVRNFIGCNMSFRRRVLDDVGDFNTAIGRVGNRPVGCEETELCIRITQHDPSARLIFDPNIAVRHWVSTDRVTLRYFLDRCFSEGLSKHKVSGMVGSGDSLSSERSYVLKVLPLGVARGLVDTIRGRGARRAALGRSMAIVAGLAATTIGYAYALVYSRVRTVRPLGGRSS